MKIAILILLHRYEYQQKKLIQHFSKDFDIFVHIDKKTSIKKDDISEQNVYVYKKYKVYWGSFNIILATLFLFKKANELKYDRYLFISGEDIPLKTNENIKKYFINNNNEYLEYSGLPRTGLSDNGWYDRIDYYYPNLFLRGGG